MSSLLAYIGPGAGIAAAGTVVITVLAVLTMLLNLLIWPIRRIWRWIRLPKRGPASVKRVIVIGLDGLDPRRVERLMEKGVMPSFSQLAERGCFERLESTHPPISPVAWSSFLTGVNPGKHGIFDFIARDPSNYLPRLSSAEVRSVRGGKGASVRGLRRSVPFWKRLGEYGIASTIIRVPITFPAEPFDGSILSAMCIPDIRGTQSSYTFFSTDIDEPDDSHSGGLWLPLISTESGFRGEIPGPGLGEGSEGRQLSVSFSLAQKSGSGEFEWSLDGGDTYPLKEGGLSDWIPLKFKMSRFRSLSGLVRAQLRRIENEGISLYLTPIQIDPARPVIPIGFPWIFSRYLSRLIGPYGTLGLAEDTSALDDGVISGETFLQQAGDIHRERELMALELMTHRQQGLFTCVFDGPDRVQHMFFHEESSPGGGSDEDKPTTIDGMYQDLDGLVGKVIGKISRNDLLLVISDHGFTSFRRGVDLNRWLEEQGLLRWENSEPEQGSLAGVDWENTRAYAFGLSGIYLNLKGRESGGIVLPEEAEPLKQQITDGLEALTDPDNSVGAIRKVHPSSGVYHGPHAADSPDLIVGYEEGYRVSWDCASGYRGKSVFVENDKAWSGDHCVDRELVPGMLLSNRRISSESGVRAQLMDLGPSILKWFGIEPPTYMDGVPLVLGEPDGGKKTV